MILNTGSRTDIPAYYSDWFFNRVAEGYVLVRNPFNPKSILKYKLSPDVIDIICFCTKNPYPMLARLDELSNFKQFWFVTITPYGRDIEPNVPNKHRVIESFKSLSDKVGINNIGWRYDPIFISDKYNVEYHLRAFKTMVTELSGYTNQCVISFIDLYEKTKRNFPSARAVTKEEQELLTKEFALIAKEYNIEIYTCSENPKLAKFGVRTDGCMSQNVLEKAVGYNLKVPNKLRTRATCDCLLGSDIGTYNTCMHACKYCYANFDMGLVSSNYQKHNKLSPLLIGEVQPEDTIKDAKQELFYDNQLSLF